MTIHQFQLLKTKRFLPLFITQFLGLFNDNVFKASLMMLITFKFIENPQQAQKLVNLIGGLYGIAFLLFSITVGQIADKYNRVKIIRFMKLLEIILISIGLASILNHYIPLALLIIFLLGLHSAFLSPIKYSLLPDLLKTDEILAGNSLVTAGTVIAILVGNILGISLGGTIQGATILCIIALGFAIIGWLLSFIIPYVKTADPDLHIGLTDIVAIFRYIFSKPNIFHTMLGIAWSIFMTAALVRQFPVYSKLLLGPEQFLVLCLYAPLAIGCVLGALLCNRLFKGIITTKHAPYALFFMSVFLGDFALGSYSFSPPLDLTSWHSLRLFFDIFGFAFALGIYIVPLFAYLLVTSNPAQRSRVMAFNNLLISFFAVLAAVVIIGLISFQLSIIQIYALMAVTNLFMIFILRKI